MPSVSRMALLPTALAAVTSQQIIKRKPSSTAPSAFQCKPNTAVLHHAMCASANMRKPEPLTRGPVGNGPHTRAAALAHARVKSTSSPSHPAHLAHERTPCVQFTASHTEALCACGRAASSTILLWYFHYFLKNNWIYGNDLSQFGLFFGTHKLYFG